MTLLVALLLAARVAAPALLPAAGTYSSAQSVTASSRFPGSTLYVTTTGATPRRVGAQRYAGAIPVSSTSTVCVRAFRTGFQPSSVVCATYTIQAAAGLCASESMRATGTTYYYCDCGTGADPACVVGNDANPGTNSSAPRRTGWKSRATTMVAGSTVALCRGGSHAGDGNNTENTSCSASSTCDVRDYTPAAHPEWATDQTKRPIISGGRLVYLPNNHPSSGFRYLNLQMADSFTGQGAAYVEIGSADIDICNVYFRDSDMGIYFSEPSGARVTVRQSQFANLSMGVLGGCDDCLVEDNFFASSAGGGTGVFDHPVYLGGASLRMKVRNNEIHGCPVGMSTGTVSIVVHGEHEDLEITNNLIQCDNPGDFPNQWGIQVGGGYSTAEHFRRSIVRRNRVLGHSRGIALDSAPNSLVEGNLVVQTSTGSIQEGISVNRDGGGGGGDEDGAGVTVRNNTIFFPGPPNWGVAFGIDHAGTGHNATNNAVFYAGTGDLCFVYQQSAGSYSVLSHNACNSTWGTTYDTNRVVLSSSPFVSAPTDFTPALGSPLVNAGTSSSTCTVLGTAASPCYAPTAIGSVTWSPIDAGVARIGGPDVGAYDR